METIARIGKLALLEVFKPENKKEGMVDFRRTVNCSDGELLLEKVIFFL